MKADTMKNERRQSIRVDTHKMVSNCRIFSAETQGRFQFTVWPTKNISTHGIAINSDENISQGALAFLNIDLDVIMKPWELLPRLSGAGSVKRDMKQALILTCGQMKMIGN